MSNRSKPLSPHISIYKPQITSVLSILHRIFGVVEYLVLIALMWWAMYMTYYGRNYADSLLYSFFTSSIGFAFLIVTSFCLAMHYTTNIRYMFWGMGKGFEMRTVTITGWLSIIGGVLITALFWVVYFSELS